MKMGEIRHRGRCWRPDLAVIDRSYLEDGGVARMESQRGSERTKAGLRRAVAQGRQLGRPRDSRDKRKRKTVA